MHYYAKRKFLKLHTYIYNIAIYTPELNMQTCKYKYIIHKQIPKVKIKLRRKGQSLLHNMKDTKIQYIHI